jgi:hypothetical protein
MRAPLYYLPILTRLHEPAESAFDQPAPGLELQVVQAQVLFNELQVANAGTRAFYASFRMTMQSVQPALRRRRVGLLCVPDNRIGFVETGQLLLPNGDLIRLVPRFIKADDTNERVAFLLVLRRWVLFQILGG